MKQYRRYLSIIAATVVAVLLAGCSKSDLPSEENNSPIALTIQVADGGYAPTTSEQPQSRAVENGYSTTFTAGDQIGLYAVQNGVIVSSCNNLCFTATDNGNGGVKWTLPADAELLYKGNQVAYYAYYPYQAEMTGKVIASATDAAGFFQPLSESWIPAIDQSTPQKYTATDLMTGRGTVGFGGLGYTLSISLSHRMALAVIQTPTIKYTLKDVGGNPLPDYILPVSGLIINGFAPCAMADGSYRYLVKPANANQQQLLGSYINATGGKQEFIFTHDIAAASYKTYRVDGTKDNEIIHTLQVGDFYMKDGSLVGKDKPLSDAQKAACLGIVMKVGKDNSGDWVDDCTYKTKGGGEMPTIHGYVLALYDANSGAECTWGSLGIKAGTSQQGTTGFYGYKDMQKIKAMNGYGQTTFPAAYWASSDYETRENGKYASPAGSSGWFLPSGGQCKYWLNNGSLLLAQVHKASGNTAYNWKYYWSSSEPESNPSGMVWYLSFDNNYLNRGSKNYSSYVRSCLAF